MAPEIVNLNKFRKAKEKAEQERQAEENRIKFGRTKAERLIDADEQARRDKLLNDVKLTVAELSNDIGHSSQSATDTELDPGTVS